MPRKDAPRTPAKRFGPPILTNVPPSPSGRTDFDESAAPPAFASAADALRAKIRACAARSFAAQHKAAVKTAGQRADDEEKSVAMAAGRNARGAGPEGPRAHS